MIFQNYYVATLIAVLLSLFLSAGCSDGNDDANNTDSNVPTPDFAEPTVGKPSLPGPFFDDIGYENFEYFISGVATSYTNINELTSAGKWEVQASENAEYTTRLVVFRPSNPASFNGTVIVEWLNVSSGTDIASDWMLTHTELTRRGYAWIGVSAQERGVDTLKSNSEERYYSLTHPGDSFSYSIFSQVAQLIRSRPDDGVLGPLNVEAILAAGESQSAAHLQLMNG